jgi:hypothetical protein
LCLAAFNVRLFHFEALHRSLERSIDSHVGWAILRFHLCTRSWCLVLP